MLYVVFREFPMTGVPFEGLMTDVQAFDRFLTPEEAIAYTTCAQVGHGNYQTNLHQTCFSTPPRTWRETLSTGATWTSGRGPTSTASSWSTRPTCALERQESEAASS